MTTSAPESPEAPADAGFQKRLGVFDSTMLVAGSMIGSGIFIVSAEISRDVGTSGWLLVVWLLTGVITVFGALSYAELAAMMPHAGGQYVYLREAYGPLWGFLYGWTLFLVIQTGLIAAVAVAFTKFAGVLWPVLGASVDAGAWYVGNPDGFKVTAGQIVAVLFIVVLTGINLLGVREGKLVQNLFTVAKIAALIVLIVLGLTVAMNPAVIAGNRADLWSGISQTAATAAVPEWGHTLGLASLMVVGGAMVGSLFSADAWNNVTFTAGEVRNPSRNLPLSLIGGTGMVIGLYMLANLAYLAALPVRGEKELDATVTSLDIALVRSKGVEGGAFEFLGKNMSAEEAQKALTETRAAVLNSASTLDRGIAYAKDDRVGTAVMELVSPGWGTTLMAVAIMISTFGCTNGLILSGARLYYAMAQDGLFFHQVGKLSRFGVPAAGLVLQAIWAILLTFSGTYSQLLDYIIFAALLFYVLTVVGLFVLRRTRPDAERPYRALGYPVLPAVYVILCTLIMLDLLVVRPLYTWPGLLIVLTGFPVYFVWRKINPPAAAPAAE